MNGDNVPELGGLLLVDTSGGPFFDSVVGED
jgi:hypothetical protein